MGPSNFQLSTSLFFTLVVPERLSSYTLYIYIKLRTYSNPSVLFMYLLFHYLCYRHFVSSHVSSSILSPATPGQSPKTFPSFR